MWTEEQFGDLLYVICAGRAWVRTSTSQCRLHYPRNPQSGRRSTATHCAATRSRLNRSAIHR